MTRAEATATGICLNRGFSSNINGTTDPRWVTSLCFGSRTFLRIRRTQTVDSDSESKKDRTTTAGTKSPRFARPLQQLPMPALTRIVFRAALEAHGARYSRRITWIATLTKTA